MLKPPPKPAALGRRKSRQIAQPVPRAPRGRRLPAPGRRGRKVTQQNNRFGLGITGGWSPGSGFSFRHYLGRTAIQGTFFAMITERGSDATLFGGLAVTRYLLVWHEYNRPGLLPDTSALRLTGSASYLYRKSVDRKVEKVKDNPACNDKLTDPCTVTQKVTETKRSQWDAFLGGGIGFEFGAVMRPGFSLSLDLILTAMFDKDELYQLLPVPAIGLMYNW